ncbi:MAG: hypothetical protein IJ141_05690 [Lachnospiraceae bacterium]|nr:hypothetical protein [Lachnospiraceae bacterium]
MDLDTGRNISSRLDIPLQDVLYMPIGKEIIFRRGQYPVFSERYDIEHDNLNIKATKMGKRVIKTKQEDK